MNNPSGGDNLFEEMALDSEVLPTDDKIQRINRLFKLLMEMNNAVEDTETRLNLQKKRLTHISDVLLPEAMAEAGCKKFITDTGLQIEVKPFYTAKIDDNNRNDCYKWLRDHNFGNIIKHQVAADFNKGEDSLAEEVKKLMDEKGISYTDKESIHHQTLTAFVKERIEKGGDSQKEEKDRFPLTLFNVFIGKTTKVKRV